MENREELKLSMKEAYESMILMLNDYYRQSGSNDLTDILSGGEYINGQPADIGIWYMWEDAVKKIIGGHPPKEKNWIE